MMRFLYMLSQISKAVAVARDHRRKISLNDQRIAELQQRRILHEAKIARENNAVILQDLEIEKKKLELEQLEKEVHPERFNPTSYEL